MLFTFVSETRMEQAWGRTEYELKIYLAKWQKPLCGSGMKKRKFREEDYQLLPLPIDSKSSHRDQLFSIEDEMRK